MLRVGRTADVVTMPVHNNIVGRNPDSCVVLANVQVADAVIGTWQQPSPRLVKICHPGKNKDDHHVLVHIMSEQQTCPTNVFFDYFILFQTF
jgi:hypothetical protein